MQTPPTQAKRPKLAPRGHRRRGVAPPMPTNSLFAERRRGKRLPFVLTECLADALDNHEKFGVWGGMTERQRRALLKQHPEVVSWSEFFAAQRKHRNTG